MRSASSPCATGIRSATRRRAAVQRLAAGRGRAAAAVSAVFDHHDRQFADRLAGGGGARRAGGATRRRCAAIPTDAGYVARHRQPVADRPGSRRGRSCDRRIGLRVLFSAHGLPEAIVRARRSLSVADRADGCGSAGRLGAGRRTGSICYQSRATPQHWIEPSTEQEIERAAHDKVAVLVVPIAFVSEHSETLVELDVGLSRAGRSAGRAGLFPGPDAECRCRLHRGAGRIWCGTRAARGPGLCSHAGGRICPADRSTVRMPAAAA